VEPSDLQEQDHNLDTLLDGKKMIPARVAAARTALRGLFREMRLVPDLPARAPEGRTNGERRGAGPVLGRFQRLNGKRGSGGRIQGTCR
jgi:hypothetical protein